MQTLNTQSRRPDITFHRNGRIDIAANIAHQLDLQKGDVIGIAVSYGETMLYVKYRAHETVGRHEATVYPTSGGRGTFRTWSTRLSASIFRIAQQSQDDTLRLPCGMQIAKGETICIPIITQNPI